MICKTALGEYYIEDNGEAITDIHKAPLAGASTACASEDDVLPSALCLKAASELQQYMRGEIKVLSFTIAFSGTPFQCKVWQALQRIPYGETRSYSEIARDIGSPRSARAVGGACHKNALLVAIPCHRVIGAHGALTGFGAGIDTKRALLQLESSIFL